MHIVVIRHGETDLNKEDRLQGSKGPDLPLNEVGRRQVEALRDTFSFTPSQIYCSPLLRTRQTAEILNTRFHSPIEFVPNLAERDFGTLSGKLRSEISPQLVADDLEGHYDYRPYGGESVIEVRERLLSFLRTLPLQSDQVVMVVAHRGIIRIFYDLFPSGAIPELIVPASKHFFDINSLPEDV